ncbi:MAG: helix-turn-helix domain-containing protein [Planctomycetes bacterium]|nr:helix-turn-helix domain-containing protein [Planctomycetota bacterium]
MTEELELADLRTVDELATTLRVSVKTVRNWIYTRRIPFTRLGRRIYIPLGVVEGMLRRNAVPALNPFQPSPSALGAGGAKAKGKSHG